MIKSILALDSDQLHLKDEETREPVHHACQAGHLEAVKELVSVDPDVLVETICEEFDEFEDNVLHLAARSGSESLVQWLLEQPQATGWQTQEGTFGQAWECALFFGHEEVAVMLLHNQVEYYNLDRQGERLGAIFELGRKFTETIVNTAEIGESIFTDDSLCPTEMDEQDINEGYESAVESDDPEFLSRVIGEITPPMWRALANYRTLFIFALYNDYKNVIRFLWKIEMLPNLYMPFGQPLAANPDCAALLLVCSLPSPGVENIVERLASSLSGLETLKMVLEGDLRAAVTRLLGFFPPLLEENIVKVLQHRENKAKLVDKFFASMVGTPRAGDRVLLDYLIGLQPTGLDMASHVIRAFEQRAEDYLEVYYDRMSEEEFHSSFTELDDHPWIRAAHYGCVRLLQYFLRRLPAELVIEDGRTLQMACRANNEKVAWVLLQHLPEVQLRRWKDPVEVHTSRCFAPIDFACFYHWSYEMIDLMISLAPELLQPHPDDTSDRMHPIFFVTCSADIDVLKLLLEKGGTQQLQFKDNEGSNVLSSLCAAGFQQHEDLDVPHMLMGRIVDRHRIKCASLILDLAPELETDCDNEQCYPIHFACDSGYEKLVDFLVARPGSRELLSQPNTKNQCPYHIAGRAGEPEIVRTVLPLTSQLALNCIDEETGITSLHAAIAAKDTDLIDYVLQHVEEAVFYSEWTCGDMTKYLPLELAIQCGQELDMIKRLVEKGGVAQITMVDDRSTFWMACLHGDLEMVEYFINLIPEPISEDKIQNLIEYLAEDVEEDDDDSLTCTAELLLLLMRYQLVSESTIHLLLGDLAGLIKKMESLQSVTQRKGAQSHRLGKRVREDSDEQHDQPNKSCKHE